MNTKYDIALLMKEYTDAHNKGDGAHIAALFLDEAVIIPPGGNRLEGRSEIDNFYKDMSGESTLKNGEYFIEFDSDLASVHGQAFWEGKEQQVYLWYVNVLRFVEGKWQYKLLTWNTDEGLT